MIQPGAHVVRSGRAQIEIDQAELLAALNRVSDGAASRFIERAKAQLAPLEAEAVKQWPVRTGLSKRSFGIESRILENRVDVALTNDARNRWGAYAFKIRWSVRTAASLDNEARQWSLKATTPAGAQAVYDWRMRQLRRAHGQGAPTEALAGKQPWRVLILGPGQKRQTVDTLIEQIKADLLRLSGG